jgi:pimeloyl-ACP methyl ester carboxylesterase
MKSFIIALLFPLSLLAVILPSKALYLEGNSDKGIILAHGKGMNPDFKVVKPLRLALHEDLGFHTLSLQMPIDHKEYEAFEAEQPKVNAMIDQAIAFLQKHGVKTIYLMGHSLGAGMTSAYIVAHPEAPLAGYIAVGCRGNKSSIISCSDNMSKIKIRTFDIWGADNADDAHFAKSRSVLVGPAYRQYGIEGANHVLDGANDFFIEEVEGWIEE